MSSTVTHLPPISHRLASPAWCPVPIHLTGRPHSHRPCNFRTPYALSEPGPSVGKTPLPGPHPVPTTRAVELELRDVSLSFGNKPVLQSLNLKVYHGQCVAIIGTSGTGKSTALRIMSGLTMPDEGQVFIRGVPRKRSLKDEVNPLDADVRIAMVFQNSALFDSLTVGENVGFTLINENKLSEQRMYDIVQLWLARVGLEGTIDKVPSELSGGMRKRASLARAIIYDPENPQGAPDVLLYDEPTAGLDPTASTRIENVISDVRSVCPTCVVVTHQFSTVKRTADRVVFMHQGSIVWDGPVDQLDTTSNPFIRQFMSSSLDGPLSTDGSLEVAQDV